MAFTNPITFEDGAAYEQMMGRWSQLVGDRFLDWLAPCAGLQWVDVGCGNGAFTEMIVDRCAPASVDAIDPSEGQLAFARGRRGSDLARYQIGDATSLPYSDQSFDAAVMALVIFFVPDPLKAVSEMKRVVRSDGLVATYAWDVTRGGFPYNALWEEMANLGVNSPRPPSSEASRIENMKELWKAANLVDVETKEFVVERCFASFDVFWQIALSTNAGTHIKNMNEADRAELQGRIAARLPSDGAGRVSYTARANAVMGRRSDAVHQQSVG
jgi:ubiquinone/menaquinone biosynthesis C-methylase UbiE